MADILCGYTADRDETLVAYLYGDIDPVQRDAFEAHIATCERCGQELAELRGVRGRLEGWTAPEAEGPLTLPLAAFIEAPALAAPRARRWRALRELPTWAQAAAAVLVLGVSAGMAGAIAHLDVRYSQEGLTLRTGWSRPEPGPLPDARTGRPTGAAPVPASVRTAAGAATPWTGDLDALEQRLRAAIRESSAANGAEHASRIDTSAADAQLLRKVRALLEESERNQRNELALRIAEVVEEFDAKRGSDLASLRNMKTIQNATGAEIVRQQQWLNLLTRTSLQK